MYSRADIVSVAVIISILHRRFQHHHPLTLNPRPFRAKHEAIEAAAHRLQAALSPAKQ